VKSLADLAAAVKQPVDGFITIETEEDPKQIALDAKTGRRGSEGLKQNYGSGVAAPGINHSSLLTWREGRGRERNFATSAGINFDGFPITRKSRLSQAIESQLITYG